MKLLKSKKILIALVVILVIITGYRLFGGSESKLEKQLIATLPSNITSCYYAEKHPWEYTGEYTDNCDTAEDELCVFVVKDFIIERQTTDGNMKIADCVIELEHEDFKRIVYANLICVRYDDGSWAVQSWSENAESKLIAKNLPSDDNIDAKRYIANYHGFTNLTETDKNIDFENGIIKYTYEVNDSFEYLSFDGEVICIREMESYEDDYGYLHYSWEYDTENNTETKWDILGTWHMEYEPAYDGIDNLRVIEITLNSIAKEKAGTAWQKEGNYQEEKYIDVCCEITGDDVYDAECRIWAIHKRGGLNNDYIDIDCSGALGNVGWIDIENPIRK